MTTQGIFINVSRKNDDLPQLIEEYSEQFNLFKGVKAPAWWVLF